MDNVFNNFVLLLDTRYRFIPSSANFFAISSPIPCQPPVIKANLSIILTFNFVPGIVMTFSINHAISIALIAWI